MLSATVWRLQWHVPFSPCTDFLLPGQGCGSREFVSKQDAIWFVKKKSANTEKVGPHDGQEIFGHELLFTLTGPNGEVTEYTRIGDELRYRVKKEAQMENGIV